MKIDPRIALLVGISAVSTASILVRLSTSPPLVIAGYRMLFSSMIMGLLGMNEISDLRRIDRKETLLLLISGVSIGAHFGAWTASLFYTSIAASTVIVDSSPIFVVLISWIFLREGVNTREAFGIAISIMGAIIIAIGHAEFKSNLYGDFLALLGAIFLAIYLVIGRILRRKMGLASYTFSVYGVAAVVLLLSALVSGNSLAADLKELIIFILLALGPSCLGHNSYNYALKYMKASVVSASILGEPVGASLLGAALLGEVPSISTIIGGGIVILGVYLTVFGKNE
ncbi:MAG: DMT family transporter [Candidatus Methanodesulfokora washburnensis]|jgi:drug/metabolite transporter (DMT)-like permease